MCRFGARAVSPFRAQSVTLFAGKIERLECIPTHKAEMRRVGKRYSPYHSVSRIESVVTISATSGRPVRR